MDERTPPGELARAYLAHFEWRRHRSPGPPPPGGALDLWERWICDDPERAWPVFEALLRLRPADDDVLEQVWHRLALLLARHGDAFGGRVRSLVEGSPRLRRIVPPAELDPAAPRPAPPDPDAVAAAYLAVAEHGDDARGIDEAIRADPRAGVRLALEIVSRGPLHGFSAYDVMSPLLEVLRRHGPGVVAEVERAAMDSALVRRVLWRMRAQQGHPRTERDIAAEVWERLERARAGTTPYDGEEPVGAAHPLAEEEERWVRAWFLREGAFWAYDHVWETVQDDPESAWDLLLRLVERAPSDSVLAYVGAGPLEDFVRLHGARFIDRIEQRARGDERLRHALCMVWRGKETPDALWDRVQRAATGEPAP